MIITLEELNKCVKALPNPLTALEQHREGWRVQIVPDMPVRPLYEEPDPYGPIIRLATFRLQKIARSGSVEWHWSPCDELVI